MESGAQCAMIAGIFMMQMWYAANLASLVRPPLLMAHNTVRDQVISGWMTSIVMEQKPRFSTVTTYKCGLQITGVSIARMQVWFV